MEEILRKYWKYVLLTIFAIAVIIRWWYLPSRNINFGYDQARDAFAAQEIIRGDLKILGLPTGGIPGLFHGVLYYYVIAPAYFFGNGDPLFAAYWLSFINALSVFPVFCLAYLLTKKMLPSIMSAFIFAFSFDAIQFSGFIQTVSLGILFIPIIFIGLFLWINKSSKYAPFITGLALGLAVQSEIAFYYYLAPILLWLVIYKKRITGKEISMFILSFILAVSTMIVSEIKFGFQGLKGLFYLFTSQDYPAQSKQFSDFMTILMNQLGDRFANTIYPLNIAFGSLLGFGLIVYSFISKSAGRAKGLLNWRNFLITIIFAHVIALPFGGSMSPYILIGVVPVFSVFIAIILCELLEQKRILLLVTVFLLLLVNLFMFVKQNISPTPNYFTNDYVLSVEIKAIDYTYQKSEQKQFSISTLTAPLFVNTLWSYLYNWYGVKKYGYLPFWVGRDQVGQSGNILKNAPVGLKEHFFIIEPTLGIPDLWIAYAKGDQNAISRLIESKSFGQMVVEERIIEDNVK